MTTARAGPVGGQPQGRAKVTQLSPWRNNRIQAIVS